MLVKMGEDLFRVLELQHVTPGNLRGFVRVKFRNIRSGALADQKLRSEDELERATLDPAGLSRRPWFKNLLYAPGLYTGYEVRTIPMVREALEQRKWDEAEEGIVRTAKVLDNVAAVIDRASSELENLAR